MTLLLQYPPQILDEGYSTCVNGTHSCIRNFVRICAAKDGNRGRQSTLQALPSPIQPILLSKIGSSLGLLTTKC